jgi:hypothetical protein
MSTPFSAPRKKGLPSRRGCGMLDTEPEKCFNKEENSMLPGFEKFLDAFFDIFGGFFASILWWLDGLNG